jgi:Na+-transporting methylmalonyl-CoA/oxaloacetate decarboxylase gamma subunit|tara:strand:- start:1 stop:138 length:138 start_codon:yes stop_codon:yes gene_type:complete
MYGQDAEFVIVVSGVAMVLIVGVTLYEAVYTMSAKWRSARRKNRR